MHLLRCVLFAFLTFSLAAQSPLGIITGVVSDPAGSVVPNAEVLLKSIDTGIERRVRTDNSGVYNFPNLTPGAYKVSVTAAGFRSLETQPIGLAAFRTARQDLKLEIQSASTEVTVREAVSGVIQLESPAISTSLNSASSRSPIVGSDRI